MLAKDDPHRQDIRRIGSIRELPLILEACHAATGMRFTAISRVTPDRWITCASLDHLGLGLLPGDELDVSSTICHEMLARHRTLVIPDVDASEIYRDHHTPRQYGFKCYISAPIVDPAGKFWGSIFAIDPEPRALEGAVSTMFEAFAGMIALGLEREEQLESGRAALVSERDTARLREEFIAVVGHDLRNPLAAISAGLSMLPKHPARAEKLIPQMQRSINRVSRIIDNLLDFARGRLGSGIDVLAPRPVLLEPTLRDVIGEIAQVADQTIEATIDLPTPVRADPQRLGQLLSNLLGNAVAYGREDTPIRVDARVDHGSLRLCVANQGAPIPQHVRASLFMPFSRSGARSSLDGLGLGLYIASQIAEAHGGGIDVESDEINGTRFTLTMPARYD